MLSNDKMSKVLDALFSEPFIPTANTKALASLCNEYKIDRVRSFARFPGTDIFTNIDDDIYGQPPLYNAVENKYDFNGTLYKKGNDNSIAIMTTLIDQPIIHTFDMDNYAPQLSKIGYTSTPHKKVNEAIIASINNKYTGFMGYIVIENFVGTPNLSSTDLEEIIKLLKIIEVGIKYDETSKLLERDERFSQTDALTQLPSIASFKERADKLLSTNTTYALFYLDIDKFKYINDIWSFSVGNDILVKVSEMLIKMVGEDELCTRVYDDKFCLLLKYNDEEHLNHIIRKIDKLFVDVHDKLFHDIKITVICGIYVAQKDENIISVIDKANTARCTVKGSFTNAFKVFNQNLKSVTDMEKEFEQRTVLALENGEFIPYLQPKFKLDTNEICGAEALARWQSPERMISPYEFIPVFEKNGFITKLDFAIYEGTFKFIRKAIDKNYKLHPISLNVSRGHVNDDDFIGRFTTLMKKYNIPKSLIELEITESIFTGDNMVLKNFIDGIRDSGINVSIDDFGSAYSSLNLLKDIDVDVIKLDKAFIDNITNNSKSIAEKDKIIITNMINMATALGFKSIFEGIELEEQVDFLKSSGCNYGQGYIFSRPLALNEFEEQFLKCTVATESYGNYIGE